MRTCQSFKTSNTSVCVCVFVYTANIHFLRKIQFSERVTIVVECAAECIIKFLVPDIMRVPEYTSFNYVVVQGQNSLVVELHVHTHARVSARIGTYPPIRRAKKENK